MYYYEKSNKGAKELVYSSAKRVHNWISFQLLYHCTTQSTMLVDSFNMYLILDCSFPRLCPPILIDVTPLRNKEC